MSTLTGTADLARLIVRRDRVRITVWVVALGLLAWFSGSSIEGLYTEAQLAELAATVETNPAVIALAGPARALDTYGGRIAFEIWQFSVAIGLMAVFAVVRHTRAEEEAGRAELLRAAPVGRHARSVAAVLVSAASSVLVGAVVTAGLLATGQPAGGSVVMGAAFAATGVAFAGATLLAAQVTEHSRAATGLAAAAVGLAFVVRALGDIGSGTLSWLSPFGWMQATRPFSGDRWWPLLLSLAVTVGLVALALAVEARRDVGAGLVQPRPGPPTGTAALAHPVGLAWRLQRSGLVGWTVGVALGGAAMGSVASNAEDLVGDNEDIRAYLAQLDGASLTDLFLVTILVYLGLVTTGFAVAAVQRARTEEAAGRVEPLLATPLSRLGWFGGHLSVAVVGTVVLMVMGGLGMGLAYGLSVGEPGQALRLGAAALALVPAVWAVVGVAAALVGLAPRLVAAAWAVVALAVVVAVLGEALDLPAAVRDLSPFTHVPGVPAVALDVAPLAVLTALAAALTGAGLLGLRRRDIG